MKISNFSELFPTLLYILSWLLPPYSSLISTFLLYRNSSEENRPSLYKLRKQFLRFLPSNQADRVDINAMEADEEEKPKSKPDNMDEEDIDEEDEDVRNSFLMPAIYYNYGK